MKERLAQPTILQEMLAGLASELKEPKINDLELIETDKDFDNQQCSLLDREETTIVTKIDRNELADAPTTNLIRRKLEAQMREAFKSHYDETKKVG